ncbi:unnamed protein product [Musa hybrid cultivar]
MQSAPVEPLLKASKIDDLSGHGPGDVPRRVRGHQRRAEGEDGGAHGELFHAVHQQQLGHCGRDNGHHGEAKFTATPEAAVVGGFQCSISSVDHKSAETSVHSLS